MPIYRKCSNCKKKLLQGTHCDCDKDRYKDYNKRVRQSGTNKKYTDFYNSGEWKRVSTHINKKYNYFCLSCLLIDDWIIPSDVVHHIETIRDDYSKRLEESNLIPLCHGCHNNIDHVNYTEEMKNKLRMLLLEYEKNFI